MPQSAISHTQASLDAVERSRRQTACGHSNLIGSSRSPPWTSILLSVCCDPDSETPDVFPQAPEAAKSMLAHQRLEGGPAIVVGPMYV